MSTVKIMNNKKRNHAEKVLQQTSKNLGPENLPHPETVGLSSGKSAKTVELKDQFNVIRDDLLKLRTDLTQGYDLARTYLEQFDSRSFVKGLLKVK